MTWVRIDDQMPDHPKVLAAGPEPMWLYTAALCWCSRHLTDGQIPKAAVPRLAVVKSPERCAAKLVEVGLWDDDGDNYQVHDYLKFQPSKAQVEAQREGARNRQRKSRSRHAVTDPVTDGVSSPTPTRPDPPHPIDAEVLYDDDPRAEGPESSSSDDPNWPVWVEFGRLALAERADPPDNPTAYVTGAARRARREKRWKLDEWREVQPDASVADLARFLYEDLDPIAMPSWSAS